MLKTTLLLNTGQLLFAYYFKFTLSKKAGLYCWCFSVVAVKCVKIALAIGQTHFLI